MERKILPKMWEDLINSSGAFPVVVSSVARIMDYRYTQPDLSVHDHFEMVYMQEGTADFQISGKKIRVRPLDVLIIKPGQPHRLDIDQQCRLIVLKFEFSLENSAQFAPVAMEDFLSFVEGYETGPCIVLRSHCRNEIVSVLNNIIIESRSEKDNSEFLCSLLVMQMFVWLSRALKAEWMGNINQNGIKNIMDAAKSYIEENYNRDIGLDDVAGYVYLSSSHFARAFKKQFNVSPIHYLLSMRAERAKTLLVHTQLKVGEVATTVGFSNQQRFNDIFKKHAGMPPGEYRERHRTDMVNKAQQGAAILDNDDICRYNDEDFCR